MNFPETYEDFRQSWTNNQQTAISSYIAKNQTFIPNLLPEQAVQMPTAQLAYILEKRFGQHDFYKALNPENTIASPVQNHENATWLKTANMVGINVRTIDSFWNVIKYSLTLPKSQSSIHLLPIWECGVVASLYGIASWNINPAFFDIELAVAFPHLNTVEKQLKVVSNLLHLMGKTVGMDVIPHTDRYSEIVLANPQFFEWLQRKEFKIIDHSENLHEKIQASILDFIYQYGGTFSEHYPRQKEKFFDNNVFSEEKRLRFLFGEKNNLEGRTQRRNKLINHLFSEGYEPVPATMAPPYRGLKVDNREEAKTVDEDGRIWRDYVITKPEGMSRVFGPLARVKLYESKNDNFDWEIDFTKPRYEVWEYMAQKYQGFASQFNFDFMRGDMSHVQMNPNKISSKPDIYYDIHKYIKKKISQEKPFFGYFAESFLAPPNTMAYGNEEDHLEGSDTDTTLGDLQSMVVGTERFISEFSRYHDLLTTRKFAPNFTIMTADKDDPRFDEFYLKGNEIRMFMGLFLTDMPSYMALGFEQRDPHPTPAPNEHYTKLYVFQLSKGDKATHGKYVWGKNGKLFYNLSVLKTISDIISPNIDTQEIEWLIKPDIKGENKIIAWTQKENPQYIFVVNLDLQNNIETDDLKNINFTKPFYSTAQRNKKDVNFEINSLKKGECRIYEI
ncbi:MAG: hypothetical protein H7339_13555 [Arcicella sp.]|nr:hypothetical protein [Arcicella sp.]